MRHAGLLLVAAFALAACSSGAKNSSVDATSTFDISGTVSGAVAAGVTIAFEGAATAAIDVTDGTGHYRFRELADGRYTITPTLAGYAFTPPSREVVISGADRGDQDFTSSVVPTATYTISGTVQGDVAGDVDVALTGAKSGSTVTDTHGNYLFSGLPNGTYTVTASRSNYTFDPPSRTVTIDGGDEVLGPFTAHAGTATWAVVPSGTTSVLRAVWGSAANDVWIVGDGPILHWDGSGLQSIENPAGRSLHAVWGASPSDVWAVGAASIVHWDGSSWTRPSSGLALDIELRGLWGSSASDIWGIGVDPWHFDGTLWTRGAAPLPKQDIIDEMDGIWGSAPNDIWAVGDDVDRFDGSRWGLYLYDCDLHGVWGTSSTNIWAVGDVIAHYNGTKWSGVPSPIGQPVTGTLRAVWGSSATDVWAVGDSKILRWDGSGWYDVQPAISDVYPLLGVWGSSASDVWMVGENGTVVRYH